MVVDFSSLKRALIFHSHFFTIVIAAFLGLPGCQGGSYGTNLGSSVTVKGLVFQAGSQNAVSGLSITDLFSGNFTKLDSDGTFEISAILEDGAEFVNLEFSDHAQISQVLAIPAHAEYVTKVKIKQLSDMSLELVDATPQPVSDMNEKNIDPMLGEVISIVNPTIELLPKIGDNYGEKEKKDKKGDGVEDTEPEETPTPPTKESPTPTPTPPSSGASKLGRHTDVDGLLASPIDGGGFLGGAFGGGDGSSAGSGDSSDGEKEKYQEPCEQFPERCKLSQQ